MSPKPRAARVGTVRPSQLLYAFGIGAVVDLPRISVVVMGIDEWDANLTVPIEEPRLLVHVREELGPQVERLVSPPREEERVPGLGSGPAFAQIPVGVPVATFPRWLVCPACRLVAPLSSELFRLSHDQYRPDRTGYIHDNCPKSRGREPTMTIPARFLVACKHGHLDDFPWVSFVHGGAVGCAGPLRMQEFGLSGEATSLRVRCDVCGKSQSMARAFEAEGKAVMPRCRGRHPHLREFEPECEEQVEGLLLGASNLWFPITLSALAIPSESNELAQLVSHHWTKLDKASTRELVQVFRELGVLRDFGAYTDEQVWEEIEQQRARADESEDEEEMETLRRPEWRAFSQHDGARNTADFRLEQVPAPAGYGAIHRVVLAERLREVQAFIGFTRIDSPDDWLFTEEMDVQTRAPISRRAPSWVPAAEVRGEGIFIQFKEEMMAQWLRRIPVAIRTREFRQAHGQWRQMRGLANTDASFPGMRYILIHSFSHALMRQLALECGYSAASLKELLYAEEPSNDREAMAGVLIYTAAPDSEGTLGGLVRLGEPQHLRHHLELALERVSLCASDPLCAEHEVKADAATLHGAACHACLFVPETSCERGNRYLDRAMLVPTFGKDDALPFFGERL